MSKTDKTKPYWVLVNESRFVEHDHRLSEVCAPQMMRGGTSPHLRSGCMYNLPSFRGVFPKFKDSENNYKRHRRRFRQSLHRLVLDPTLWDDFDYSDRQIDDWLMW